MKKYYLTLFALFTMAHFSYGQWTILGTNIHYNTGNVGIGTTSPVTALDIQNANTNYSSTLILKNTSNTIASRAGLTMENNAGNRTVLYKQASGNPDANDLIVYSSQGDTRIYTADTERLRIANSGNVGVGVSDPKAKLDVAGAIHIGTSGAGEYLAGQGSYLGWDKSLTYGEMNFINNKGWGSGGFTFDDTTDGISFTRLLTILGNGNVGIGTISPDQRLSVNGTIHSKEVKVDLNIPAPDYVFEPEYKLADLEDLKNYLHKHHHLPEMPSASEMGKEGINLSDMNMKLLKKVEELTLYLIEKDKQLFEQQEAVTQQQRVNHEQQKKSAQQDTRIVILEKAISNLITTK